MEKSNFTILKWNGEYGNKASFVVKDNNTDKQSVFTPGRTKDMSWTDKDLAGSGDHKGWEAFGDEQIEDLAEVVF